MKNTSTSLLLTALLAASGFAAAQSPTAPATRAEVKSEVVRPSSSTSPGSLSEPPKPGTTSETTRAQVKSEVVRPDASVPPRNLSEPPKPGLNSNTTRAQAKAGVDRYDRELSTGEKAARETPSKNAVQRKAMRDERRAMKKSKAQAQMNSSGSAAPAMAPAVTK